MMKAKTESYTEPANKFIREKNDSCKSYMKINCYVV